MRIVCLQEKLKTTLSDLERVVSKNQNTPILSSVIIKTGEGSTSFFGTDLEIGMEATITCKVEKRGEVAVPIKLLSYFVQNLPNTKVTIEEKPGKLLIEAENTKTTIPTTNKDEFPLIPKVKKEKEIAIDTHKLKEAITQVLNATASSFSIPEISGIFFDLRGDVLRVVSTDSFRLSEKTIFKKAFSAPTPTSFIIPQKTAQELSRVLPHEGTAGIRLEQNQTLIDCGDTKIFSRLIAGTYPNYEQIIPKSSKTKTLFNKNELVAKMKLASAFTSRLNNVLVSVNVKKGEVELSASDESKGEFSTVLRAETSGESAEAHFNYRYVLDGLNNILGETVIFEMNGPAAAATLSSEDDPYRYVMMPIKI